MNREIQSRLLQISILTDNTDELEEILWAESHPSGLSCEMGRKKIIIYYPPERFPQKDFILRIRRLPYVERVISRIIYKKDWNSRWQRSVKPVKITDDFIIIPPFRKYMKSPYRRRKIIINPAMAFGTGHHESTLGIMRLIYRYREHIIGRSVADFGSGSGILSVFARLLGSGIADAYDFDPECGNALEENMKLNYIDGIRFFNRSIRSCRRKYDVIFANMLFGEISSNRNVIMRSVKKGGLIFFAGILQCEREEFIKLFNKFRLRDDLLLNDWVSFVFEKV